MATAEFPSNSNSGDSRIDQIEKLKTPQPPAEETIKKPEASSEKEVFEGKVFVKRKKLGPRLKSMFVTDGMGFVDHLVENVVVPMVKDIMLSVIVQIGDNTKRGFEQMLFPNGSSTNDVRTSRAPGPIDYSTISRGSGSSMRRGSVTAYQQRKSNQLDDLVFEYRSDAQKVLAHLQELIDEISHCTVGDLYNVVDPNKIQSTDENWGWTDISRSYIRDEGRDGFMLILPDPRPIHRR